MELPIFVQKRRTVFFEKEVEPYELENIVNPLFQLTSVQMILVVAAHVCFTTS